MFSFQLSRDERMPPFDGARFGERMAPERCLVGVLGCMGGRDVGVMVVVFWMDSAVIGVIVVAFRRAHRGRIN